MTKMDGAGRQSKLRSQVVGVSPQFSQQRLPKEPPQTLIPQPCKLYGLVYVS
ncbi:MAG TPA: hypothetical protein V6D14_07785 [Coleofasciculaceae cyanobacterium]